MCWCANMAAILVLFFSLIFKRAAVAYDFIVGNETMTWNEPEDWCLHEHGRHLASIHNDTQNAQASAACGATDCWIGATCKDSSWGDWSWSDGTIWSYTDWNSGEPNNNNDDHNEGCVHIYGQGVWNDIYCGKVFLPLCGNPGIPSTNTLPSTLR